MSGVFAEILTLAEKVNNYLTPASAFDSTTQHQYVVPTGKRWFVLGGTCNRNAAATITITARDVSDQILIHIDYQGSSTGVHSWPNSNASGTEYFYTFPLVLDAGEYIRIVYSAAQGAGAFSSCVVLEVDV